MQIDFKALEQALAPIAEIGQGELTFDAGGTTITVRVLRPSEEIEAQKFAASALDGEDTNHAAVDYLDRFRIACLSHAIVAVGSQDFRDVDYVATGDKLDNGTLVKVPKHKAMRELLGRWTRSALAAVFNKFHELVDRTEKEAEQAIIFEPSNIPSEIDRLQQRIEGLRHEMDKAQAVEKTKFSETMASAAALVQQQSASPQEEPEPTPIPEPAPAAAPAPRRAGPVTPQQAAPPPERSAAASQPQVVHVPAPTEAPPSAPPVPRAPPPRADSSFINADDEDGMNAAMDAEHHRLLDMRRRAAQGQRPQSDDSALDTIHPQLQQPRRRPPHQDAADTEAEVGFVEAAAQRARELGATPDGVPVFAMPAQDLDTPTSRGRPDRNALNPQVQGGGATNPRFQGPRRP